MNKIKRQEFLFLYESIFANANGDPLNENRPRIDEETRMQYVTMYRLKRTVREYLKLLHAIYPDKYQNILFRDERHEKGGKIVLKNMEQLLENAGLNSQKMTIEDITKLFIDARLFGGVFAIKGNNLSLQGPIQISYGKSLHEVKEVDVQIAPVLPSNDKSQNGTLGFQYIVPYALIASDGTINQFNASQSGLSQNDIELFYQSLWQGTNELKTTSKNQKSILLLNVIFKDEYELSTIGNLKDYVKVDSSLDDDALRSVNDFKLDITDIVNKLKSIDYKIEEVQLQYESKLSFIYNGENVDNLEELIPNLKKKVI